jgi:iron(III) transport system substrate-binding protein
MGIGNRIPGVLAAVTTVCAWAAASSALAQSVVCSAVSPKLVTAFVEEFQKQNPGVKVDLISGGSGALLTRLQAQRANPRADVLVGPDADSFDAYLDLF